MSGAVALRGCSEFGKLGWGGGASRGVYVYVCGGSGNGWVVCTEVRNWDQRCSWSLMALSGGFVWCVNMRRLFFSPSILGIE